MRFVLMIIVFFAAVEAVDTLYFDGQYRTVIWQDVKHQGQQIRYQLNSFVHKDIDPQ